MNKIFPSILLFVFLIGSLFSETIVVQNYTFNKATKQITFTDFTSIKLESIEQIICLKNGRFLFRASQPDTSGTVSGNVLTLTYDTNNSEFSNSDKLQIKYVLGSSDSPSVTSLSSISSNLGAQADSAATTDTGTFSLVSFIKRGLQNWTTLLNRIPASGSQSPSQSFPVTLPNDVTITGQIALTTGNNAIATDGATATDVRNYHSGSVQVIASAGISAGAVIFEQSNDGSNWNILPVLEQSATAQTQQTAAITIAASTSRHFYFPISANNIRLRISTNFVGGSIQAFTNLSQLPFSNTALVLNQATAANLNATVTATNLSSNIAQVAAGTASSMIEQAGTSNRALNISLAAPSHANVTEVASAAVTATANGSTITQVAGAGFSAIVNCTAVSGTTPTLDTILQESNDNGTTWYDIWHVERMTGVSTAIIPPIPAGGRRRWNSTVGGTTPSFTRSITTMLISGDPVLQRQFFDRTAGVLNGTLNATTSSYNTAGINNLNVTVTLGAATTPGTYQIQVSNDGSNWASASTATAAVANSTISIPRTVGVLGRFSRLICTSAATSQTGTLVSFYGSN